MASKMRPETSIGIVRQHARDLGIDDLPILQIGGLEALKAEIAKVEAGKKPEPEPVKA